MVSPTIQVQVPWYEVLQLLQIPVNSKALPILITCPLCSQPQLHLYDYRRFGGAWFHCNACEASGDVMDLAGLVLRTTPEAAMFALNRQGLSLSPETLQGGNFARPILRDRDMQQRCRNLWQRAQAYLREGHRSPSLQFLRGRMRLTTDISSARWAEGPGLLVGAAPKAVVHQCLFPHADSKDGSQRILHGRDWRDVLVVPFYDLPGRISGFGFAGRRVSKPDDFIFRACGTHFHPTRGDPGLAFLPAVNLSGRSREVIAINDWSLGLKLHMRHFRVSMTALPLVAWYTDGRQTTTDAWQCLSSHRVVFWAPQLDPHSILQAINTDGYLSTLGPHTTGFNEIRKWVYELSSEQVKEQVLGTAKPWRRALQNWIGHSRPGECDRLMQSLEQAGGDVGYIMRACQKTGLISSLSRRVITYGNDRVIEQVNSWHMQAINAGSKRTAITPSEVLNCVLRITHTLKDESTGRIYHRGYVRFRDQRAFFIERAEVLQEDAFAFITWLLHDRELGTASCPPEQRKKLYGFAIQFYEPKFVVGDLKTWQYHTSIKPVDQIR